MFYVCKRNFSTEHGSRVLPKVVLVVNGHFEISVDHQRQSGSSPVFALRCKRREREISIDLGLRIWNTDVEKNLAAVSFQDGGTKHVKGIPTGFSSGTGILQSYLLSNNWPARHFLKRSGGKQEAVFRLHS